MPPISPATVETLRARLPQTANACVRAIVEEVPGYDREFDSKLLGNITSAVQLALAAFLDSLDIQSPDAADATRPRDSRVAMRTGAYRLGQGEAETGRSTDALLTAYRVGAREAWSQFAAGALAAGEDASAIAALASGTFTFIDDLSAQSLAGHTSAMTARTRELARRRDDLAAALIAGENKGTLDHLAERAHWTPPRTLTALVVRGEVPPRTLAGVGERTLWSRTPDAASLALVPDLTPSTRARLLRSCVPATAALGPSVPWSQASESVTRARRALRFADEEHPADCDALMPELLLDADPLVTALLRERALAPLADTSPGKREVLVDTLLSWLLHQGRRDDVANELHVHPQTVRYRMNTMRELYGERLTDPRAALELTLGLLADRTRQEHAS